MHHPKRSHVRTACTLVVLLITSVLLVPSLAQQAPADQVQAAEKLLQSGDVAGGIAALQKIAAASPSSFDVHLLLGRFLDLEGRHAEARTYLEQAVKAGDR